jgi:hypothetical protein
VSAEHGVWPKRGHDVKSIRHELMSLASRRHRGVKIISNADDFTTLDRTADPILHRSMRSRRLGTLIVFRSEDRMNGKEFA